MARMKKCPAFQPGIQITGWSAREISARFVIRMAHLLGNPIYFGNEERVGCIFVKDVLKAVMYTRPIRLRRQEIALQVATFDSTNSKKMVGTRSCARFVIRLIELHGNPIYSEN